MRHTRWAGCTLRNRYYWYCYGYSRTIAVTDLPEEVVCLPEAHALGCQRIPDSIPPGMVCVPICALPTVPQCCGPNPACHVALWLPGRCRAARCMTHAMLHAVNNISSHFKCGIMLAATRHVVHWIARGMTRRSYATNMQWAQWGRALDSSRVVPRHIVHTIQVELRTTQHAVQCSIRSHERRPIVCDCTHACIQLDWLAWRA